jgi:hypothetical protein
MSWLEKLAKLYGRPPYTPGLDYHAKLFKLKGREEAAKDIFEIVIANPKEKAKAKKLGLLTK